MAEVIVVKGEDGKLAGMGDKGSRAWLRFLAMVDRLQIGDSIRFAFWEPRSPGHHRAFFRMLNALFERQEQFEDVDRLRAWLTVGAGEADFVPGPTGRMVALPKSIAWDRLDEADFAELVKRVNKFLWSDHATAFLWPHLTPQKRYEMLDHLELELR